jgi:hypothetical protein
MFGNGDLASNFLLHWGYCPVASLRLPLIIRMKTSALSPIFTQPSSRDYKTFFATAAATWPELDKPANMVESAGNVAPDFAPRICPSIAETIIFGKIIAIIDKSVKKSIG